MTAPKIIPVSRNPRYLKWSKRILNNTMSNTIITPTWCCGFNVMFFSCLLFVSLGYMLYSEANNIREFSIRYDEECKEVRGTGLPCYVTFEPDVDMDDPKVYYRLNNFYQNHRTFQMFSFAQLRGESEGSAKIDQCEDIQKNKDMLSDIEKWDLTTHYPLSLQTEESAEEDAWPCGNIAKFAFNDVFTEIRSLDSSIYVTINDTDIANDVDKEKKFIMNDDLYTEGAYWRDVTDEHLMVWYQMETLKDFKKLYGHVTGKIQKGKIYTVEIIDNYDSEVLDNEKHLVLTEIGTFGGKNFVLAYFMFAAAAISAMVLVFFVVGLFMCVKGRRIEEESYIAQLSY